ncbi:YciY family protein [Budvicia diplopodorum]|uniref:YciY family protein n=1 Tax=Budvicia diplopodorum TaxID=1119056 RepID=UPI00135C24BE|nr:YciY family protein [Budvicia diplopodorum]
MQRTRTEVGRWRLLRQAQRRRNRWLEGQSRRNSRIQRIRVDRQLGRQKRSLLYATNYKW